MSVLGSALTYTALAGVAIALAVTAYSYVSAGLKQRRIAARTAEWLSQLSRSSPASLAATSPWVGKRVLCILNPMSGSGNSRRWCRQLVRPVLEAHGMTLTVLETQRAGHAAEFIASHAQLEHYDLLLMISGDGLLNEVVNALVGREMTPAERALDPSTPAFHAALKKALHVIPIAILPGGTSNGLSASLFTPKADVVDVLQKVLSSAPRDCDIMAVTSPFAGAEKDSIANEHTRRSVGGQGYAADASKGPAETHLRVDMLCFLYGLVADNDDYAERRLRSWPMLLRTIVAPLLAIALNRSYHADVRVLPALDGLSDAEKAKWHYSDTEAIEPWTGERGATGASASSSSAAAKGWRQWVGDRWTSIVLMNVPWPASDVLLAPSARVDDGRLYFCAVRGVQSRATMLKIFVDIENGTQNAMDEVDILPATSVVIHPRTSEGHMIISGEELPVRPTKVDIQHKAAFFVY